MTMPHEPSSSTPVSGSVKLIGRMKAMPIKHPMGTDQTIARGRLMEGLCTSSAMLVAIKQA